MRHLCAALILLCLTGCSSVSQKYHIQKLRPSVVLINVTAPGGAHGNGTGTVVQCTPVAGIYVLDILTAKHVVDGYLSSVNGQDVLVALHHPEVDLALIRVLSDKPLPCAPLSPRVLEAGDPVLSFGYSGRDPHPWISAGMSMGGDQCSTNSMPGDSGGPLMDAETGHVVGVITMVYCFQGSIICHHAYCEPMCRALPWIQATLADWSSIRLN